MNQESTPLNTNCPKCGVDFSCDVTAGSTYCWCMQEASVLAVPSPGSDARCMCPECLRSVRAQRAGVFTPS